MQEIDLVADERYHMRAWNPPSAIRITKSSSLYHTCMRLLNTIFTNRLTHQLPDNVSSLGISFGSTISGNSRLTIGVFAPSDNKIASNPQKISPTNVPPTSPKINPPVRQKTRPAIVP